MKTPMPGEESALDWRWGGADVDYQTRREWVTELLRQMVLLDLDQWSISSGAWSVFAERTEDGDIEIWETRRERSARIDAETIADLKAGRR